MPSKSAKQHRLMEAVAHDPAVAKRTGVPQSVGEEFVKADKADGKTYRGRGHHGSNAKSRTGKTRTWTGR